MLVGNVEVVEDPTILKVTGGNKSYKENKESVKKLSYAVLQTLQKHGVAKLRCVGAAAINNADKAIIIASMQASRRNLSIYEKKSFVKINFTTNEGIVEKTGILKEVYFADELIEEALVNGNFDNRDNSTDDAIDIDEDNSEVV